MAQPVKHNPEPVKHNEPHTHEVATTAVPQTTAADPPVKTIADEQRERSAVYEANLGQPPEDATTSKK